MENTLKWNAEVDKRLAERFKALPRSLDYHRGLWADHLGAGLANFHFVSELTKGSDEKFRQRVWEMSLGRHLRACGHDITTRPDGWPDYLFEVGGQRVWVEAISPSPGLNLPSHWTTHNLLDQGPECVLVPNEEMLLRWTAAFKAKAEKCDKYRCSGVVKPEDAFVIAIDGSQLSKFPNAHGISQLPFVVECVFAVGPLACQIDRQTGKSGEAVHTVRTSIKNRNKSDVSTEYFFQFEFSGVSAVLGCHSVAYAGNMLVAQVAHNPLATSKVKLGLFGDGAEEWTACLVSEDDGGRDWELKHMS